MEEYTKTFKLCAPFSKMFLCPVSREDGEKYLESKNSFFLKENILIFIIKV